MAAPRKQAVSIPQRVTAELIRNGGHMASDQAVNHLPDRQRGQHLTEKGNWIASSVAWVAVIAMCVAVIWVLLYTPAY